MSRSESENHNRSLGARGEEIVTAYLKGQKFVVVERNFRCKAGEIDIIAREGKCLVFVEVKTRRDESYGPPQASVTSFKQRQISKAALSWLAKNGKQDVSARFDVVAVVLHDHAVPRIEHIRNAFELAY
ncbi:MAG TPA: YraN family protein [Geobacteraceae bacterium]